MPTRMLIDARHREETRVAVVKNNRIEEFDFESAEHKQLKGNIYLAKVTRVEPSLQAAFVDYGGNRHGFLAFSEIHPDYYQIPKEDRERLLAEEAEQAREEAEIRESEDDRAAAAAAADGDAEVEETGEGEAEDEHHDEPSVQSIRRRRVDLRRRYKIQDVIRRRQVLLVQVVKEERGNKGAALTTYLSLAGRYCVLMPNTSHGGGISRKISNASDRKRLKSIVDEMKLPSTMGCIIRTAGMTRTKTEIKRDFTYLARLWDEIREKTLRATAPAKIHTDSDLIKRAIRDIYNREIEEVIVESEEGYKAARDFMKLLMPSHVRRVKAYADPTPLFQRFHVEDQLEAMYQPLVQLKSGGYLVINPTEALVSIDINSGRATREHNIEQTALKTNIEAAQEIARQLRLRDMAGLIVIDFIDMDQHSHNRKVEKALKDALKNDRARIQVGRISTFGLLEMSRQRLRTGVLEASTRQCQHCGGTGLMRTASSAGLSALRMLEEESAQGKGSRVSLTCSEDAAIYVLNAKRAEIGEIEERYGVRIEVVPDRNFEGAAMEIEISGPPPEKRFEAPPIEIEEDDEDLAEIEDEFDEEEDEGEAASRRRPRNRRGGRGRRSDGRSDSRSERNSDEDEDEEGEGGDERPEAAAGEEDEDSKPRRRSRRGRRGGRRRRKGGEQGAEQSAGDERESAEAGEGGTDEAETGEAREAVEAAAEVAPEAENAGAGQQAEATQPEAAEAKPRRTRRKKAEEGEAEAKPSRRRKPKAEAAEAAETAAEAAEQAPEPEQQAAPPPEAGEKAPRRRSRSRKAAETAEASEAAEAAESAGDSGELEPAATAESDTAVADRGEEEPAEAEGKPRRGWWQRTFGE